MANSYSNVYIMIVFAIKERFCLLNENIETELFSYMSKIISNRKHHLIAVNGYRDHVHLLINLHPDQSISDLVRDIKSISSKFINEKKWFAGKFQWQSGYGVFSYSESQIQDVIAYVNNQKIHHKTFSFKMEYLKLLQVFKIDYHDKYLFEFLE